MEVQDTKDSRREMPTLQEVVAQQSLVLQRLERTLRRLEESHDKISSRLDAIENARPGNGTAETPAAAERGRYGAMGGFVGPGTGNREVLRERVSRLHRNPAASQASGGNAPSSDSDGSAHGGNGPDKASQMSDAQASQPNLLSRAKVALRGVIADGTVNATLNRVQSSLKLADEATGALAEISALVKASLTEEPGLQGSEVPPVPAGSLSLLLELAKTPQFQRFVASMLAQFLKDPVPDVPASTV
ncbi:MAG: hypothetical protein NUW12_00885 [Firmicutes bacterium]|jgi:hypothetical protein|nr:hypothetical protein [Bacillota bacterium]MDH7494504.1 hypothetical protein [Bacillota bacterium]